MSEGSAQQPLTRRDFIKLAGAAVGGLTELAAKTTVLTTISATLAGCAPAGNGDRGRPGEVAETKLFDLSPDIETALGVNGRQIVQAAAITYFKGFPTGARSVFIHCKHLNSSELYIAESGKLTLNLKPLVDLSSRSSSSDTPVNKNNFTIVELLECALFEGLTPAAKYSKKIWATGDIGIFGKPNEITEPRCTGVRYDGFNLVWVGSDNEIVFPWLERGLSMRVALSLYRKYSPPNPLTRMFGNLVGRIHQEFSITDSEALDYQRNNGLKAYSGRVLNSTESDESAANLMYFLYSLSLKLPNESTSQDEDYLVEYGIQHIKDFRANGGTLTDA